MCGDFDIYWRKHVVAAFVGYALRAIRVTT
jgi:hypothetical protein